MRHLLSLLVAGLLGQSLAFTAKADGSCSYSQTCFPDGHCVYCTTCCDSTGFCWSNCW